MSSIGPGKIIHQADIIIPQIPPTTDKTADKSSKAMDVL